MDSFFYSLPVNDETLSPMKWQSSQNENQNQTIYIWRLDCIEFESTYLVLNYSSVADAEPATENYGSK